MAKRIRARILLAFAGSRGKLVLVGLIVGIGGTIFTFSGHALTPITSVEAEQGTPGTGAAMIADATASGGGAIKFGSGASCAVSALLVNPCRPWLGADTNYYTGPLSLSQGVASQESRIGRNLDVVHDYRTPGQTMSADDVTYATRANTMLMMNWKPAASWASADGSNSSVNAQILNMAKSIQAIAPKKNIFGSLP